MKARVLNLFGGSVFVALLLVIMFGGVVLAAQGPECLYSSNVNGMDNPFHIARISHTTPVARVSVNPPYQGRFTSRGVEEIFEFSIWNNGTMGSDVYDISVTSAWDVSFHDDAGTVLKDTDSDGVMDTGLLAQGETVMVTARVTAPVIANVGDYNVVSVTVRSSLDTTYSKEIALQTAIPAPFVQIYSDYRLSMSHYRVQPDYQEERFITDVASAYNPAVAQTPSGFAFVWNFEHSLLASDIEYSLIDADGDPLVYRGKVTSNAVTYPYDIRDYAPAVAVSPDGYIGVLWYRLILNTITNEVNYNMYFVVLGEANYFYGPFNITNHTHWDQESAYNLPHFSSPEIVATEDNRFVLAWKQEVTVSLSENCSLPCTLGDIYYAVRDINGVEVKAVTNFTNGEAGFDDYQDPALTALSDNRVLLAYTHYHDPDSVYPMYYAVLNSAGDTLKAETWTEAYGRGVDAVELSDGNIVIAGTYGDPRFVVVDSAYNVASEMITLENPISVSGDDYVSIAADAAGHAILTWVEHNADLRRDLYYALVDATGAVITPPMIFHTKRDHYSALITSLEGNGITSYNVYQPVEGMDLWIRPPAQVGGIPGGSSILKVGFGNQGSVSGASTILTATLDADLGYVNAEPAPTLMNANVLSWELDTMGFLGEGDIVLRLELPSTAIGTRYPITWTIAATEADALPENNFVRTEIMISQQLFLPLTCRDH